MPKTIKSAKQSAKSQNGLTKSEVSTDQLRIGADSYHRATSPAFAGIVTKQELARELRLSPRTIENMCAQRIIPFIRATKRSIRFHLPRVLAALEKRETHEAAR